jgi:6,7-dimethyl-8-ribityllumazine synthase
MIEQLASPTSQSVKSRELKIGIIVARQHLQSINGMFSQVYEVLRQAGVEPEDLRVVSVPTADDLASVARTLVTGNFFDAIICLGYATKSTACFHMLVEGSPAQGLQWVAFYAGIPIIFCLTSAKSSQQTGEQLQRATESAQVALRMARRSAS